MGCSQTHVSPVSRVTCGAEINVQSVCGYIETLHIGLGVLITYIMYWLNVPNLTFIIVSEHRLHTCTSDSDVTDV